MSSDTPDRDRPELAEVAPDDFLSTWGASSYEEALDRAAQAPTTTPPDELKRCPDPECGSARVVPKSPKNSGSNTKPGDYKCTNCLNHFSDPVFYDPKTEPHPNEGDDGGDPFVWADEEDLAEPPVRRVRQQLAELDDLALSALAVRLYAPWAPDDDGPSYREISEVLPYSRQWVGERVRSWRNSDHFGGEGE